MDSDLEHREAIMTEMPSQHHVTLHELSSAAPVVVVFLRHLGCSFCRQTLSDLQAARPELTALGVGIALVHMGTDRDAERLFAQFGLDDAPRFSDPDRRFYKAFGLRIGGYRELWTPRVLAEGLKAASEHGAGRPRGNPFQLAGVFLAEQGHIIAGRQFVTAAERPDYVALVAQHFFHDSSASDVVQSAVEAEPAGAPVST